MSEKDLLEELLELGDDLPTENDEENVILAPLLNEINLINDQTIRVFTRAILLRVNHFWTIPSSFSGKYHPPDERGVGGNVLHTQRVVRVVSLMCDAQERMQIEKDLMISAALLHDILKGGAWETTDPQYDPLHPYTVDRLVEKARDEDAESDLTGSFSNSAFLEDEYVHQILRLIRCHLGKWSPIPETVPVTTLEWSLHIADLSAAELHTIIDGEEVNEQRWGIES